MSAIYTVACVHLQTQSLPQAVVSRASELCLPITPQRSVPKHTSNSMNPVTPLLQLWALNTRGTKRRSKCSWSRDHLVAASSRQAKTKDTALPCTQQRLPRLATMLSTLMPGMSLLCTEALNSGTIFFHPTPIKCLSCRCAHAW